MAPTPPKRTGRKAPGTAGRSGGKRSGAAGESGTRTGRAAPPPDSGPDLGPEPDLGPDADLGSDPNLGPDPGPGPDAEPEDPFTVSSMKAGFSPDCMSCPVGLFLFAMRQARPEVSEHLVRAGQEVVLAMKALLDGATERMEQGNRLQRITVR